MDDLGRRLRGRREELGLSQSELEERTGLDTKTIRRYEQGLNHPGYLALVALSEGLELSLDELAGRPRKPIPMNETLTPALAQMTNVFLAHLNDTDSPPPQIRQAIAIVRTYLDKEFLA